MKKRPVYLNLFAMRFPVTAIASILHRVSGVLVFLAIPGMLWVLNQSLVSEAQFKHIQSGLHSHAFKLLVWLVLSGLAYHLFAGVRHLLMDMGVGESWSKAKFSAYGTLLLTVASVILIGVWLW